MKKIFALILAALMLLALPSCGDKTPQYRDDVAVADIAKLAEAKIAKRDNLADATDEFLAFYLEVDASLYSDFLVRRPTGSASIDEYGIFLATSDDNAAAIAGKLKTYLEGRVSAWDTRYDQSEKPKVDGAKVAQFGRYVCYTILSAAERDAFLLTAELAVTK